MNRTVTPSGAIPYSNAAPRMTALDVGVPVASFGPRARELARRALPLWRHAVWGGTLFAVLSLAASVRLDVQQMRKDLDRNARHTREARVLHDRLRLEMDARRRAVAMEAVAAQLQLGPEARVQKVEALSR